LYYLSFIILVNIALAILPSLTPFPCPRAAKSRKAEEQAAAAAAEVDQEELVDDILADDDDTDPQEAASQAEAERLQTVVAQQQSERAELREKNLTIEGNRPGREFFKKLDASVKKNTAFVKKLKTTMTEAQQQMLLADVDKLNLSRYLEEVTASLAQAGKIKNASLETTVSLAVSLHQRYDEFGEGFKTALEAGLKLPDPTDKESVVYYR
jgi:hypothetical protein